MGWNGDDGGDDSDSGVGVGVNVSTGVRLG